MAADLRQYSRDFLVEFIDLYRSFPCLWRVKSREYCDRRKKTDAYERLIEKYKEVDSRANRETITKKINSLRSVYRKEVIKINKSKQDGGEVYQPSLWYFDLLNFLSDQDAPIEFKTVNESLNDELHQICEDVRNKEFHKASPPKRFKIEIGREPVQQPKILYNSEKLSQPNSTEDEFHAFGKMVGMEMRKLKNPQQAIAQKLISDVIFYAKMGRLFEDSNITDTHRSVCVPSPLYVQSPSPSVHSTFSEPTSPEQDTQPQQTVDTIESVTT